MIEYTFNQVIIHFMLAIKIQFSFHCVNIFEDNSAQTQNKSYVDFSPEASIELYNLSLSLVLKKCEQYESL